MPFRFRADTIRSPTIAARCFVVNIGKVYTRVTFPCQVLPLRGRNFPVKLPRVTKEERRALKEWLTEMLPAKVSREDVADTLGVTRKTISNMLNPERASFANGLTMLRYLQLVGVVDEAPGASPAASRLEELRDEVRDVAALTRRALELLGEPQADEAPQSRRTGTDG